MVGLTKGSGQTAVAAATNYSTMKTMLKNSNAETKANYVSVNIKRVLKLSKQPLMSKH
ncbi:hypothetical protein NBRC111893_455 [Lentilactobacillus kosonis]|uniref:Uncharacterized protein n=1 Tax=Lentilactobacillus kosonis TaxID=2810561 RepID=A0A401FIX8_9LACO|nr:hypothetical protein NBRC111893_455 [Lentilactobacillus kosonis]